MKDIKKVRSILRLLFLVLLVFICVYVIKKYTTDILQILKHGNMEEMETYIEEKGKDGLWVIVILQVLQTITVFFPGIPIYMCAGIIFGKLKGTLICYLTYVVSNMAVFIFARRVKKTANELFDHSKYEEKLNYLRSKIKNPVLFVMALCVVPVVPNGIIPYIASKSGLKYKEFLLAVAVGCLPGIFLFVCCGELLMSKYFWLVVGVLLVVAVASGLGYLIKNKRR